MKVMLLPVFVGGREHGKPLPTFAYSKTRPMPEIRVPLPPPRRLHFIDRKVVEREVSSPAPIETEIYKRRRVYSDELPLPFCPFDAFCEVSVEAVEVADAAILYWGIGPKVEDPYDG